MRNENEEDTASGGAPDQPNVSDPQKVDPATLDDDDKPVENPSGG